MAAMAQSMVFLEPSSKKETSLLVASPCCHSSQPKFHNTQLKFQSSEVGEASNTMTGMEMAR